MSAPESRYQSHEFTWKEGKEENNIQGECLQTTSLTGKRQTQNTRAVGFHLLVELVELWIPICV